MTKETTKNKWYIGGLHFECIECGNCCAGPEEGYIWITRPEIELLAEHLGITIGQLRKKYLRRVGMRTSIREERASKDCIFLTDMGNRRGCAIYPVRPNQCRTWPFWSSNLSSPNAWNVAAMKCPGINRGRFYSYEEIQTLKAKKKWWPDAKK